MATTASEKLHQTITKIARYMAIEWDLSIHEVVGAVESAKLELWNEWESNTLPQEPELDDDDDDDF